jgi:hypothetical protein
MKSHRTTKRFKTMASNIPQSAIRNQATFPFPIFFSVPRTKEICHACWNPR